MKALYISIVILIFGLLVVQSNQTGDIDIEDILLADGDVGKGFVKDKTNFLYR